MKKILIFCLIIVSLFAFCSCTSNLTADEEYELLFSAKIPIVVIEASFIYEIGKVECLIGFADYVFVGKVKEYKKTITDTPSEIPETVYSVEVIENIKGRLTTNADIEIIKYGGLSENYKKIILYARDGLPRIDELYIFSMRALESGEIKAEGENITIKIKNTDNYKEDTEYKKFITAFENEIVYDRERFKSSYEQV